MHTIQYRSEKPCVAAISKQCWPVGFKPLATLDFDEVPEAKCAASWACVGVGIATRAL